MSATEIPRTKVLFVCLGNICRSPMAEGVFDMVLAARGLTRRCVVASAGTGSWHIGAPPDTRAIAAAGLRGIDISMQRARQFAAGDFSEQTLICGMDRENLAGLRAHPGYPGSAETRLLCDFSDLHRGMDVPDPYYGGDAGFGDVLNLLEQVLPHVADYIAGKP